MTPKQIKEAVEKYEYSLGYYGTTGRNMALEREAVKLYEQTLRQQAEIEALKAAHCQLCGMRLIPKEEEDGRACCRNCRQCRSGGGMGVCDIKRTYVYWNAHCEHYEGEFK